VVEQNHGHEYDGNTGEHCLGGQIPLGAICGSVHRRRLFQIGDGTAHAERQLLSHLEQGVGGAH
jgi:hypothetical protein